MNLENIVLVTTVNNVSLFKQTVAFFPKDIILYAIDGSDGLYGLNSIKFIFKKLKKQRIKWLIMVDEDVIFTNLSILNNLIKNLEEDNVDVCGIRDGGLLSWRDKNPFIPNPFFCILNLESIFPIYSESDILKNNYIIKDEFNDDLSNLRYSYNKDSLFEDYYCFFLWLRRKGLKFKFLKAENAGFENDYETTSVYGLNDEVFLYHTWYARTYGINENHTNRIDMVIGKGTRIEEFENRDIIWFKNYIFSFKKRIRKLKNKIHNLLNKWIILK